jgi:hypothetical protein
MFELRFVNVQVYLHEHLTSLQTCGWEDHIHMTKKTFYKLGEW